MDSQDRKYSNTDKIRKKFGNQFDMFIVPAAKDTKQVSKGRGKGGLVTLWNKSLTKYVSRVSSSNFRVQATKFTFPEASILVINSYFPCDPRVENFDDTEILNTLAEIVSIARRTDCPNIFLSGDLNCHFSRNNRFTNMVQNCLIGELGLTIMWQHPDRDSSHFIQEIDYTHLQMCNNVPTYSIIDHFVISPGVHRVIREAGVLHSGANPSNHSLIYAKFAVGGIDPQVESIRSPPRSSWDRATEDARAQFKEKLESKLKDLNVPADFLACKDFHCKEHTKCLEEYTMGVMQSMESAGKECLPSVGSPAKSLRKPVLGWTEHVKPYQLESIFWHSIWISLGKPRYGDSFWNMIHSKNQYKYAVRRLKRAQNKLQNDKFVSSITKGGVNIFQEIKKYRGVRSTISSIVDEEVGATNIANHFATIYSGLYNKVELGDRLENISRDLEENINAQSQYQVDRVTKDLVKEAMRRMKPKKSDAVFDMVSDFYINGPEELVSHLTALIKMFLIHGCVPNFVLMCSLVPLVKDNLGDITSSENYRAIAGGCLLLKLLDTIVLLLEGCKLGCDELQFGYQAEASTSMCTWAVTAVIDHFNRNGRPVYGCAMDMSKAFDLVEWGELFTTLKNRGVDPIFLRLLLFIYRNQQCDVKWAGKFSSKFSVCNGVRQGAVSSAILFSVYINELFLILRKAGFGCHINGIFLGCFGYADDIFLLSASRSGLQTMVNLSQSFASKKSLKFSTNVNPDKSKTKCLIFSKKSKDRVGILPVLLDNAPLPWVSQVKHLGNLLQVDNSMRLDISLKRAKFIGKVSSLLQEFGNVDPEIKVKILNIYTTSFYGSNLWDIFSKDCERLYKSWNVAMRLIFEVSRCTHRYLIEPMSKSLHPKTMLCSRYVGFYKSLIQSSKLSVRILAKLFKGDQRTVLGRTLFTLCRLSDAQNTDSISCQTVKKNVKYFVVPEAEAWRVDMVSELLKLRKETLSLPGFNLEEIQDILDSVCTD